MHDPVIKITNLSKHFGDVKAVDDISLTINKGDIYGVLGANGAGKTTTISLILSLLEATDGSIEVLGENLTPNNNAILKNVGALVGDGPAYFPYMTSRENVAYMAKRFGVKPHKVDEVLEFIGISEAADRRPDFYSTGMKQRLGIAMAIIHKPQILILDEPTNGMDPAGMRDIRELIKKLAGIGTTIVLCSHLLHEVEQVCNRIAIFNKGKIVTEKSLIDLQKSTETVCVDTEYITETADLATSKGLSISKNQDIIEITGMGSKSLINLLVQNSLTPTQVYTKENNLEDLYLNLINS